MPRFRDIPQFTSEGNYCVNIGLDYLPKVLEEYKAQGLQMCPDFQRGHVWTEEQQISYVEYLLRGGKSARAIYFNHAAWMRSFEGEFVLVDGLQRLTAAMRFLNNEIPVFGHYRSEYTDKLPSLTGPCFEFHVNDLKTRREVLRWYIEMNSGGTPHTKEEIERVRELLAKEE